MSAWGQQPHQIGSLAIGQTGGGGPTLLARRPFLVSTTDIPPANTASATVRAVGSGAGGFAGGGSGGGAFARVKVPCTSGSTVSVAVGAAPAAASAGNPSSVTIGGTVVCLAVGGNATTGGQASACIGDVAYSGGGPNQAGTNGGSPGVNGGNGGGGGGSAGERNAIDAVILGGVGAASSTDNGFPQPGFPGGGGARSASNLSIGAAGLVFIEYWSA